jgi:hypothetical protein
MVKVLMKASIIPPTMLTTELIPFMYKVQKNSRIRSTNQALFSHLYRMSNYSPPYKTLGKHSDKLDQTELPDVQYDVEEATSNQPKTSFVLMEDDIEEF